MEVPQATTATKRAKGRTRVPPQGTVVVGEHAVHRQVANVFGKLGLSFRAWPRSGMRLAATSSEPVASVCPIHAWPERAIFFRVPNMAQSGEVASSGTRLNGACKLRWQTREGGRAMS